MFNVVKINLLWKTLWFPSLCLHFSFCLNFLFTLTMLFWKNIHFAALFWTEQKCLTLHANGCYFTKIMCFGFWELLHCLLLSESIWRKHYTIKNISQAKYSRPEKTKFVEDSLQKIKDTVTLNFLKTVSHKFHLV